MRKSDKRVLMRCGKSCAATSTLAPHRSLASSFFEETHDERKSSKSSKAVSKAVSVRQEVSN